MRFTRGPAVAFVAAGALCAACRGTASSDPPDPSASPQAKAEPAPIASPPSTLPGAAPAGSASAGSPFTPPPQPLRPDEAVPLEPLPREPGRELTAREAREAAKDQPPIYTLLFALRASDVAGPPKAVELSAPGLEAARRKAEPSLTIDLMPGTPAHARTVLHEGFVLPEGTELRVRADRFGYVVVAPDGDSYRVGATGSLRAILGEGLFEVAPSSLPVVVARGEGARRLGHETRRVEVMTRAARASFELAHVPDAADAGSLVCRMLLDLMSAGPATPVCGDGDVPLHVELKWSAQPPQAPGGRARVSGVSVFDAISFVHRTDLTAASFLTPPPTARFVPTGEPVSGSHLLLTRADLAAIHIGTGEASATHPADAAVLSLHNSTDELRFVWLDGVPLAWLAPGGRLDVSGVPHVRVTVQWRTFLGDAIDPGETLTLPAMVDALPGPGRPLTSSDSPPP